MRCLPANSSVVVAARVQRDDAGRDAVLDDDVDGLAVLEDRDVGVARDLAQRQLDVRAGRVAAGVDDAVAAVRGLAAERHLAVDAVEGHAEAHEVGDAVRGFGGEDARRFGVDQAGAGVQRVLEMQLGAVVGANCGRDAALRVLRVASSMLPLVSTSTLPCSRAMSAA